MKAEMRNITAMMTMMAITELLSSGSIVGVTD